MLYRLLPLEGYLRAVSRLFFLWRRLGLGRYAPETEYVYYLPELVGRGDVAIDIGANLGYYSRPLSKLVGERGHVYSVEPMPPVLEVLRHNLRRCRNVTILPYALGEQDGEITMANDSARETGYLGTGQNFVNESGGSADVEYRAKMRRGSELFADLKRLDFIKCDIEGYELHVMHEMLPLLERFRPTVLIETGGENRRRIIDLFSGLGYSGYMLEHGVMVPVSYSEEKDIIFMPAGDKPETK